MRQTPNPSIERLDPMAAYSWSCPSCGVTNRPSNGRCLACGCPQQASATQIEEHHSAFVAMGGTVLPSASSFLRPELGAAQVLGSAALLALGVWPFPWRALSPLGLCLVVVGTLCSLAALWSGPLFEASAFRAVAFVLGVALVLFGLCGGKHLRSTFRRSSNDGV